MNDEFLTTVRTDVSINEAAVMLSVDPRTIRRAIARGDIEARRIGPRLIRIRLEALRNYGRAIGGDAGRSA